MDYLIKELLDAVKLIFSLDREFLLIVYVSLKLAVISTTIASIIGVPFAVWITMKQQFKGKQALITVLNTCMSLPTVVVGLLVYSLITRQGPLGQFSLLFTQQAIIFGQAILIFPIITSLTISALKGMDFRVKKTLDALGATNIQGFPVFLKEARYGIISAVIAGFGRVFAEVGVSMMLGGNIKHYTRTITTTIALETSKGEFALGIALGMILLFVAFSINIVFSKLQRGMYDSH